MLVKFCDVLIGGNWSKGLFSHSCNACHLYLLIFGPILFKFSYWIMWIRIIPFIIELGELFRIISLSFWKLVDYGKNMHLYWESCHIIYIRKSKRNYMCCPAVWNPDFTGFPGWRARAPSTCLASICLHVEATYISCNHSTEFRQMEAWPKMPAQRLQCLAHDIAGIPGTSGTAWS